MIDLITGWAVIATCLFALAFVTWQNARTRHRDVVARLNRELVQARATAYTYRPYYETALAEYEARP